MYDLEIFKTPHRLTAARISQLTGVSLNTARRYLREGRAPAPVVRLLKIMHLGELPTSCKSWQGWQVRGKWLIDDEGGCYEAAEIKSRWLLWQMVSAQRRRDPEQLRLF